MDQSPQDLEETKHSKEKCKKWLPLPKGTVVLLDTNHQVTWLIAQQIIMDFMLSSATSEKMIIHMRPLFHEMEKQHNSTFKKCAYKGIFLKSRVVRFFSL